MGVFKLLKEPLTKGCRYTVTDENGKVISERTSKRDYVACTANGEYYFGRLDLIGKGEHGLKLARVRAILFNPKKAYTDWGINSCSIEEFTATFKRRFEELNEIAYL